MLGVLISSWFGLRAVFGAASLLYLIAAFMAVICLPRNPSTGISSPVLSAQEIAVIELVLQGKKFREVAVELSISESLVKTYMKRVCEKTGVKSKDGLIALLSG